MTYEEISQDTDVIREALEHQRLTIARDLHDEVGSGLTSLNLELAWIERHSDGVVAKRAREARSHVAELANAGHRLLTNIRAPESDEDFLNTLRSQVARVKRQSSLDISFNCQLSGYKLPEDVRQVVYFAILESLTNVQRHAGASAVQIILAAHVGYVSLIVVDDGVGLPKAANAQSNRFGLRGIEERAKLVNGFFSVWSGTQPGTTVCLHIPIQPETQPSVASLKTDHVSI